MRVNCSGLNVSSVSIGDQTQQILDYPKIIKESVDGCLAGDFSKIKDINMPFDEILKGLEKYYGLHLPNPNGELLKKFSKDKGRLFEFVFKTGAFIKSPTLMSLISHNTVMYEDLKSCRSFSYKSGWKGTSDEWGADVIVLDKTTDTVWAYTSKSKQNITLSKTEWQRMLNLDRNLEFLGKEIAIGFIVDDKNEFMKNRSSQLGNYKFNV